MSLLLDVFRTRLLPAIVAALGASFIAAGLLSYVGAESGDNIFVRPTLRPEPTLFAEASSEPSAAPSPSVTAPASPGTRPSTSATASANPSASTGPKPSRTPKPSTKPDRIATRVVVPALEIDLPVIKPPGGPTAYPVCNVAMYLQNLSQPGLPGATYLYAHARTGMFLPLLENSRVNDGKRMIGMLVEVYTSDNQYFLYEIYQVRRHQLSLEDALAAKSTQLWLQTSEGPKGTPEKLQIVAKLLTNGPADPEEAHPKAKPVVCG